MQQRLEALGEFLLERYPGSRLVLTVDETARKLEAMQKAPPPEERSEVIREHGINYEVRPGLGHKTGFFADQRDHRLMIAGLAKSRRVLDLCCNSGGFALNAAKAGAKSVLAIDLDERSVDQVRANLKRNRLKGEVLHGDAFEYLRGCKTGKFDLLILDPPRWAAHKGEVEQASRRYRDLNQLAFAASEPGTLILSCSCSGPLSEDRFLSILRQAAARAGRNLRIRYLGGAAPDHPVALECPETRYLKVLLLEVV
ncbi:MAG: class I SAM-dependent rRNA methyltransferase [Planctomycetota bacterium]|jgi:23S rRNA (cytosine1962-C5)-methyltransferase